MNGLGERIEKMRLQDQEKRQLVIDERVQKWNRIKAEAPDVALLLTEIKKTFGKPRYVSVEVKGERIL